MQSTTEEDSDCRYCCYCCLCDSHIKSKGKELFSTLYDYDLSAQLIANLFLSNLANLFYQNLVDFYDFEAFLFAIKINTKALRT